MLAAIVGEITHAFATRIGRFTDSNIVTRTNAGTVKGESPAADIATDFLQCVKAGLAVLGDGKRSDAPFIRRMDKSNRSR